MLQLGVALKMPRVDGVH